MTAPPPSLQDKNFREELALRLKDELRRNSVPGGAAGILLREEMTVACEGVTSLENPLPVTEDTLFQIGSITKTFTCACLLRLVQDGRLDLDRPVRDDLPGFRVSDEMASANVTPRHLLTHRCGWEGDFFVDTGEGDDALARYIALMAGQPQIVPVGSHFSYNNSGFNLAGRLVETATGMSFEEALAALVLHPLGLERVFLKPADVVTHRFAVGHLVIDGEARVARPWALPRAGNPVGGIATDIRDLLAYARFNLGSGRGAGGEGVLAPETMQSMHAAQHEIWDGGEAVGFSWFIDDIDGARVVRHQGSTNGQVSGLFLVPEAGFAVAILTNADRGAAVVREIKEWALRWLLGLNTDPPELLNPTGSELTPYVGRYERPFARVVLELHGRELIARIEFKEGFPSKDDPPPPNPEPMRLGLTGQDRFRILDGPWKDGKMDALRTEGGKIGWLRAYSRIHIREG